MCNLYSLNKNRDAVAQFFRVSHNRAAARSPVLLTREDEFATWLTGTSDEAFGLIKTSDPQRMRIVQSGFEKKDLQQAA